MRRSLIALALTGSIALCGCDLAPKYLRPGMPVAPALPSGPAYPAPTARAPVPADIAWRDFFTDPRLQRLIEIALVNNRDLRIAVANVAQSRAQFRAQRADLFPTISATGSATFEQESSSQLGGTSTGASGASASGGAAPSRRVDIYSANVGISAWEIDLFGRVRNQTKEAFETYLASDEARNASQVSLISEVADAYLTLAADREALQIATETTKSDLDTLNLTRSKFAVGVSSELDVRQAQTSYDTARGQVEKATTQAAQDVNALELLLGASAPPELLPDRLPVGGAMIPALPVGLSSDVLLRRPDIAEAEHKLRAANADIGAARAAFFPQISLTAALGTLSSSLSGLFNSVNTTWSVEPQVSQTLFDFGKNKANLRYSQASRDVAVAQYEMAIQTGFKEVANALAQRGTIGRQIEAQTSLIDAASASYRLSDARYRVGADTFLNTLDAQRTLYSAQQDLVTTRLTEQSNMVELYRSLGGGLK